MCHTILAAISITKCVQQENIFAYYLFPSLASLDLELVIGRVVFLFEMRLDLVDGATHVVAVEADVVCLESAP